MASSSCVSARNAQHTIDGVKARLKSLKNSLPEGWRSSPCTTAPDLIQRAIDNLSGKLVEGVRRGGAGLPSFLFHLRFPLWWSSPPIAILTAFIVMHLQDQRQHHVAGGIAIAIGAMVTAPS